MSPWIRILLAIFLLMACAIAPPAASATGIALSDAMLDWSGVTFTHSNSLTITHIDQADFQAGSWVSTTLGRTADDFRARSTHPLDWSHTAATSVYSNGLGSATARALTANGLLTSHAEAITTLQAWSVNTGQSHSFTDSLFWLYGSGVGSITVSVPYSLSVACNETQPEGTASVYDVTWATASVSLMMGPGTGWYTTDTVSCNGPLTANGILTLSRDFTNPFWGPLVSISTSASTEAIANVVPESSVTRLLAQALALIGGWSLWRRRGVAAIHKP